jgi:hypothetical protein
MSSAGWRIEFELGSGTGSRETPCYFSAALRHYLTVHNRIAAVAIQMGNIPAAKGQKGTPATKLSSKKTTSIRRQERSPTACPRPTYKRRSYCCADRMSGRIDK